MEDSYNVDPDLSKKPKTSTDSKDNSKTTGDSEVQDGEGVVRPEAQEKPYEKSEEQQEYIDQANNNTESANESPVQNGKGMTMLANITGKDDDDDDDNDDDDDDDPLTEPEIGDDPNETKKKIPVM
ncbi:MAG: hypothetical protein JWQ09_1378 [Segetibacter sp.]|nr:hypothetical protein [Segetibacter sp.]